MDAESTLAAVQLLMALGGVVVMLLSSIARRDDAVLAFGAVALAFSNSNPVTELPSVAGFGAPWLVLVSVGLILSVHFRIPLRRLVRGTGSVHEILWLGAFVYMLFVAFAFSPETVDSLRKVASAILVVLVGWHILGAAISSDPNLIRHRMGVVVSAANAATIVFLASLLALAGPEALRSNPYSRVQIGDAIVVSRLQIPGLFNATAVGIAAVNGMLVVAHWFSRTKNALLRASLAALFAGLLGALVWSAARGSLFGAWGATIFILVFTALATARRRVLALAAGVVMLFLPSATEGYWQSLIFRSSHFRGVSESSLEDVAFAERFDPALRVMAAAGPGAWIFGQGLGASDYYAHRVRFYEIESFFVHLVFEWGIPGGLAYMLILLSGTWAVWRFDWQEARSGVPGSWLFGALLAFQWAISPFSYTFGLFTGSLALTFGIMAAAVAGTTRQPVARSASVASAGKLDSKLSGELHATG